MSGRIMSWRVMSRRVRRAVLTLHLSVSVGWIGAVIAYLALGLAARLGSSELTIRGAWIAMELVGWYVIVPLAVASLTTGILMAAGTPWGLFNHYWVVISLVFTSIAVLVLVLHMPDVSAAANVARTASLAELQQLGSDLAHPAIGLVILVVVQVLNIYKPRGLTAYGQRRIERLRTQSAQS